MDKIREQFEQLYQDVLDVAEVVINNGEIVTTRVYEFYDGTEYLSCTDYDECLAVFIFL